MAESVRESTLRQALRFRNLDGISAKAMDTLTGGPFLAGLALALGASTLQIGLIAAIPFLSKVVFVPAVWLVERVRRRRRICLVSHALGRPLLVAVAAGALLLSPDRALWGLMGGLALYSVLATFAGLAWNAWMKDLLPARIRGRVFSRRLWLMGIAGMALSLGGALWVDWAGRTEAGTLAPLAWLFGVGAGIGVIGLVFLGRIPEFPTPAGERVPLRQTLARPFRDRNFRQLIWFSGSWAFATNLAIPFITVYMLSELGLSFQLVIAFSVASQLANLAFLNIWGRVSDRLGNRGVLFACTPVFSLSLLLWTFTLDDVVWFTLALIALIHVMNGLATAGIDVANDSILFQLSPAQQATPYFAAAALVNSVAAGVAPIVGGLLGNAFAGHTLALRLLWDEASVTVLTFAHLEFVFLIAFLFGLVALNRLTRVREREREAPRQAVVRSVREEIQNIATIRGMRHLTQAASFFAGLLLDSGAWAEDADRDRSAER